MNDKVPGSDASKLKDSLCLISPQTLTIHVQKEGGMFGPSKKKVRAEFKYNDIIYIFSVTDRVVEDFYLSQNYGEFKLKILRAEYLCA